MSRRKKKRSIKLDRAETRFSAMKSIEPFFDFGNGLTTDAFREAIDEAKQALARYNTLLSTLDDAYSSYMALERKVSNLSERMLTGVSMRYGKTSSEYAMAGGKRQPVKWEARSVAEAESTATPVAVD